MAFDKSDCLFQNCREKRNQWADDCTYIKNTKPWYIGPLKLNSKTASFLKYYIQYKYKEVNL